MNRNDIEEPTKYLLFKGRVTFSPPTLNNFVYTLFLAQEWQKRHSQGQIAQYSYQKWIQLIEKTSELSQDYYKFSNVNESTSQWNIQMFRTWSVYGNGLASTQYQTIGWLDTQAEKPFVYFQNNQGQTISEFGASRSVICDMDLGAQMCSKWLNFEVDLKINNKKKKYKFQPNSYRNYSQKTLNREGFQAGLGLWFFIGEAENILQIEEQQKQQPNQHKFYQNFLKNKVFLKKGQYRYNHETKLSTSVGYITDSNVNVSCQNLQGWRQILFGKTSFLFKPTKNGLILDLLGIAFDKVGEDGFSEVYPLKNSFKLECQGQILAFLENLNFHQIVNKQAGLYFIKGLKGVPQKAVSLTFTYQFSDENKQTTLQGIEKQYFLCASEYFRKSRVSGEKIFFEDQINNYVELDFYCTRYGKPINQTITLKIMPLQSWTSAVVDVYNSKESGSDSTQKKVIQILQQALKIPEFKQKYKSMENINQTVYGNKLDLFIQLADKIYDRWVFPQLQGNTVVRWKIMKNKGKIEVLKGLYDKFVTKKKEQQKVQIFKLIFQNQENDGTLKAKFIDGKKSIRFRLNEDVTKENNSRHQALSSILMFGILQILKKNEVVSSSDSIACKFYESQDPIKSNKIDWVHDVGPILKKMALVYPVMQKTIDLYNLSALHMQAMRRCFEIEDELHSRYMPSTRQLSQIDHRKIRKWLYEPIFDASKIHYGEEHFHNLKKNMFLSTRKISHTRENLLQQFNYKKLDLIHHLKKAFKIELSTIPIYSSAYFSSKHKNTSQVIYKIMKDQMKHLFIVSNILNSLHDDKVYTNIKAVPFTDPQYIPTYPLTDMPIFKVTNNEKLKNFFKFDIDSCHEEQILKFICLELPGDIKHINLKHDSYSKYFKKQDYVQIKIKRMNDVFNQIREQIDKYPNTFKTIGQFYSEIFDKFWHLYDLEAFINNDSKDKQKVKIFTGDPRKQFTYFGMGNMIEVYDLRSALDQLRQIVSEGQGSNLYSQNNIKNQYCHFIKFIEIYSGCNSKIEVKNMDSNKAEINLLLQKGEYYVPKEGSEYEEKNWLPEHDKIVNKAISLQLCEERFQNLKCYPDAGAKTAFLNTYEEVLKGLDAIFNIDYQKFKIASQKHHQKTFSSIELQKAFNEHRRKSMEDSISKMRQLRHHAEKTIHPLTQEVPKPNPKIGSRPDWNIEFGKKQIFQCPAQNMFENNEER